MTSSSKTTPKPIIPAKNQDFLGMVISELGVPDTNGNRVFLEGWAQVEGTKANFNPLATTLNEPGATQFNSVGVKNYPNAQTGAKATADTIRNYPNILGELQTGSPIVDGITAGIVKDFGIWSQGSKNEGTPQWEANAQNYARSVYLNAQGNPKGLSSSDWTSYDANDAANTAKNAVKSLDPFNNWGKYVVYGFAALGGITLVAIGLILIGADLGLALLARNRVAQNGQRTVSAIGGYRTQKREAQARQERQARTTARSNELHERRIRRADQQEKLNRARIRQQQARARIEEHNAREIKKPAKPGSVKATSIRVVK